MLGRHPPVFHAVGHQDRGSHLVDIVLDGAALDPVPVLLPVGDHHGVDGVVDLLRERVFLEDQVDVGDADVVDAAPVQFRREAQAGHRRVAAVAGAVDADAPGIDNALGDEVFHAVGDVVLHLAAPLAVTGGAQPGAVAGRAAEVRLEHGVAAVGQKLHLLVPAPVVAGGRPAVRMDDKREVFAIAAIGDGQEPVDDQPVAGGVLDGLHRGHFRGINPLGEIEQFFHLGLLFVADVQQVVGADGLLAVRMEEDAVLLFRPVLDVVGHAGQCVVDHRLVVFVILVEPVDLRPLGLVAHPEHLAGLVGHDRRPRRHVVRRVGEDHPAQFPGLEVVLKQRSLVAVERGDVEDVGVRAETKRLHGGAKIGGVNFLPVRLGVSAVEDRPYEAMLGNPDANDLFAVGDKLKNVTPIEDNPFFLRGEGVQSDDVSVEGPLLAEPPAAFANRDQNVAAFIRQRVEQLDGLEHATAKFPVRLEGRIEHLVPGAIAVHGVQAAVGEIVAILHLENQALVADPVETVHLVFVLRSAAKQLAVGEANGKQVVFALTRRDGGEPLAVRREAHPAEFRVLEEGLDRQFLRLAKRGEQGQGQAKREWCVDCFHVAQIVVAGRLPLKGVELYRLGLGDSTS